MYNRDSLVVPYRASEHIHKPLIGTINELKKINSGKGFDNFLAFPLQV